MAQRIVVGMSGGVDSAVAALTLKRQGYDVIGVFMKNWEEQDEDGVCTSAQDWQDVQRICDAIDIPYYSVNFAREYMDRVFKYFLDEYRRGRTPNPDVLCNREIKFGTLLDFALQLGADKLATGHYAGVEERSGEYLLRRSADENKDQTYFLYMLGQHALSRAMFPIGGMTKPELRRIAAENNIPVSQKKDSTGVCFIGERNFKKFLMQYLPAQPGDMRTLDGKVVGHHDGLMYYTLGQRRGLGIGGSGDGRRWFVVGKDLQNNVLLVEQGEDSPLLYSDAAECELPSWAAGHAPVEPGERLECKVRLRHRQLLQDAYLALTDDGFRLDFAQKQRAVTPGQAAVVYVGDYCLGGGTVRAAL